MTKIKFSYLNIFYLLSFFYIGYAAVVHSFDNLGTTGYRFVPIYTIVGISIIRVFTNQGAYKKQFEYIMAAMLLFAVVFTFFFYNR